MSASIANLSEHSTIDQSSVFDGEEAPSSMGSQSSFALLPPDEQIGTDHLLRAKFLCVELLKIDVQGETVRDLLTAASPADDEITTAKVQKAQQCLRDELALLVERKVISEDGDYDDLGKLITWVSHLLRMRSTSVTYTYLQDIRNEEARAEQCESRRTQLNELLAAARKEANDLMNRIDTYGAYKERCLKRMEGG